LATTEAYEAPAAPDAAGFDDVAVVVAVVRGAGSSFVRGASKVVKASSTNGAPRAVGAVEALARVGFTTPCVASLVQGLADFARHVIGRTLRVPFRPSFLELN
jgi:hypothetical protein